MNAGIVKIKVWNALLSALIAIVVLPSLLLAATTDTPKAREEIEKYGNTYSGKQIGGLRAIYKEYIHDADFETSVATRDLSYGPDPRHRLDVLQPHTMPDELMPVLVFIHGGAFVAGNRSDGEIFDNVLNYFTARGVLGINATYRLAPEHQWPSGVEDMGGIMRWIRENAAEYGGDPNRIFLLGHSAGAAHVAAYTFMEEYQVDGGKDGLRGTILFSGIYSAASDGANVAYYGDDETKWAARMPINHVAGRSVPLFIVDAEYDRLKTQTEAVKLTQAVCQRDGKCPMHKQLIGHNHYSINYHINTADDSVASDLMAFITEQSAD